MSKVIIGLIACLMLAPQAPISLFFDLPLGWRVRDNPPPGMVLFHPPGIAPGKECTVMILPAQDYAGTAQAFAEQLVRNASAATRIISGPEYTDFGAFRVAVLTQQTSQQQVESVAIHVARWGSRAQAVIFMTTDQDLFRTHWPTVRAMLARGAASLATSSVGNTPPSAVVTTPPGRPRVVEAYRRPAQRTQPSFYGSTVVERVHFERIVLLSNGVADFVRYHAFGLGADPELLTATPQTLNGYYGTWRAQGNSVILRRQPALPEEVMVRENGTLRRGDQVWTPTPRVDGLRLSGTYAYRSDQVAAPMPFNFWVEFTPDGQFRTGGLLSWLAVSDMTGRPKPPQNVSGTYQIRDWTLFFIVNGTTIWTTEFMPLHDDVTNLGVVLIDTYPFRRQ